MAKDAMPSKKKSKKSYIFRKKVVYIKKKLYLCISFQFGRQKPTSRGRAVVARRAHNPEVAGSSPVPATKKGNF